MIAFLSGTVAAVLPPQTAYIDVAGVGYAVAMPGGDLGKLAVGDTARVLTYLVRDGERYRAVRLPL